MPYPLPLTRTEAYLAYKAGVIQQSDLKPSLAVPRNGIDAWLAYWTGLAADYPKREDGTPHILQEEEAYIAYLSGVINEYPEKCLRRVGAYLRYLISARWGRPDRPLNREELYLSLIKTQFIPSGDPSSDITIDGTAKAPFVDVKMYGDTFQQTYTGRNILPNNLQTQTINGVTFTRNADGSITIKGTATARTEPRLWQISDGGSLVFASGTNYFNTTSTTIYYYAKAYYSILPNSASGAMPSDRNCSYAYIRVERGESIDTTIYPQIVKGDAALDYEPFVGGVPSPNPEYPQQIQTVTGLQTVEVQGKNLFRAKDGQYRDNTLTVDVENGVIHVYGHQHASYDQNVWIPVEDIHADGTYTLTMNYSGSGGGDFRLTKDKSYQAANNFGGTYYSPNRGTPVTASATNITYNWVLIYLGHGSSLSEVDYYINPQFESGSLSTYFSPYSKQTYQLDLGSIELCKIVGFGSSIYRDTIYKNLTDSKWYLKKELGKYVFNGSEAWTQSGRTTTDMYVGALGIVSLGITADESRNKSLANRAIITSVSAAGTFSIFNTSSGVSQCMCYAVSSSYASSLTQFKGKLATDNLIVYAPLATPTDTVITDQNLINQLNALKQGGAENGTTYIKVNATDPNLPGLLYVEAPKYE